MKIRDNYNQWHATYHVTDKERTEQSFESHLSRLNPVSGKSLLDVGCGQGHFLNVATRFGLNAQGIDLSDEAVKCAKEKGLIASQGNAENLQFATNSFDYVTCLGSLEHFNDIPKALSEIQRVMKPDGRVMILVPNLMFIGHVYLAMRYGSMPSEGLQGFSEQYYTFQGWKDLIEGQSLKVEQWFTFNDIFASIKVSKATQLVWNIALKHIISAKLSYAFIFICTKG